MNIRNVLVFPAGTEIGLEICAALKDAKEVKLFGAGQDLSNHAKFAYPEYHVLPSIHEAGWLDELVRLCAKLSIDYIFPAYDDVIVALSEEAENIPAKIVSPGKEVCRLTRSKSDTYKRLAKHIRVPYLFENEACVNNFPVFVKPDKGQGSFGIKIATDLSSLQDAVASIKEPIVCEYLPGEEYTVDCFSDRDQGLLFAGARVRRRVRNGISVNSDSISLPEAQVIAESIHQELGMWGAWFFQLKRAADGSLALLEVAPRIAGTMATHRVLGVNFPLLSIFEIERLPLGIQMNAGRVEVDRALANRYAHDIKFTVVYMDLDDTLLINGKVNTELIKLIFQCINSNKKVKLITRHRGDLESTLATHRINGLFDEIIHVESEEKKSTYILEESAIFIDDSFAERREVFLAKKIPTFDCSMVEILIQQSSGKNGFHYEQQTG